MKRNLNLLIDVLLLLLMAAVSGIGILMKYFIIPGSQRAARYGRPVELHFLEWDRHEWGALHLWLSYALLALVVLHIVLHWKQVLGMFKRIMPANAVRYITLAILLLLCLFLIFWPFFITIEVSEGGHHGHGHGAKQGRGMGKKWGKTAVPPGKVTAPDKK